MGATLLIVVSLFVMKATVEKKLLYSFCVLFIHESIDFARYYLTEVQKV
jgi:hypothetical protein